MGKRRSSRELTLKFLYQVEMNAGQWQDQLGQFWEINPCQEDIQNFTVDLVETVLRHREEIDKTIETYSEHWTLERMAVIDRNLLRLAAAEILFTKNVPPKVAIDEAVEIAKKYGGEESPNFINGILDRILKQADASLVRPNTE